MVVQIWSITIVHGDGGSLETFLLSNPDTLKAPSQFLNLVFVSANGTCRIVTSRSKP